MMKLLDKLLKKLNTDRNTFFTFVLTLVTFYICIDRIVEMLLMIFTGVSSSYWGPFRYTLAYASAAFAYMFAPTSKFANNKATKVTLFYTYMIAVYIIAVSMFTQWLNGGLWLLLTSVPNYSNIITTFPSLVRHAFCAIAIYIPLTTFYPFIAKQILLGIDDSSEQVKSIWDYKGINLSDKSIKHNSYMCDVCFVYDFNTGKKAIFGERSRYRSLLVCGGSGTGKTSRVFEPMIAQDIEKKFFFKEASKELGYTALKTGIATLNKPYSNEYLNQNFRLNMLTPSFGKETIYKTFMKKMLLSSSSEYIYRDIGLTYLSPDAESINKMIEVCDNYNVPYTIIDPLNQSQQIGINPFIYDDPNKIAITISSTLAGIKLEPSEHFTEDIVIQILENLTILLKIVYPKMHDGVLPNMEDLLKLLNNFSLIQKMCKILKNDDSLLEDNTLLISFLENNFYPDSTGLQNTQKYAQYISGRLENILRSPKVRQLLCNRHNNIDFDKALANGEFIFVCTRRGDSGKFLSTALGIFFLLSMQNAVLRRPGTESTRIPHYLYIDEFPDYLSRDTETIFTMYRKYCIGTTISAQSISMFGETSMSNTNNKSSSSTYNTTILANCSSKVFTGGATPTNELDWWSKEIGEWRQWSYKRDLKASTGELGDFKDVKYEWTSKMKAGTSQFYGDNRCGYKLVGDSGKPENSEGIINLMPSKYNDKHKGKKYDFAKFISPDGITGEDSDSNSDNSGKFKPEKVTFENDSNEFDPIQSNSKYLLDNDDAIVININKKKKNS